MNSTVADVMTRDVVTVDGLAPFKEVARLMHEHHVSALPVIDEDGVMLGIVSEGDLIVKEEGAFLERSRFGLRRGLHAKAAAAAAWELMTTSVISVRPEDALGTAARLMRKHGVKRLPVLDERGRIVGIVSRADLLRVFLRRDADIAREVREDVIRRTLWIEPDTIRVSVTDGVVTLEGNVEQASLLPVIERLVRSIDGVVGVDERLSAPVEPPIEPPHAVGVVGSGSRWTPR